jgi:hypothetical protein
MTFANGWTVSVQHGVGNYCQHHLREEGAVNTRTSSSAEVGIIPPNHSGEIKVEGWCAPYRVAEIIAEVSTRKVEG